MKTRSILAWSLAAAAVQAQYFSEGWKPGQPAQLPLHGDGLNTASKKGASSGWVPPASKQSSQPGTDESSQPGEGLAALWTKLTTKSAASNTTFNPAIVTLSHTPHLAPLWGKPLSKEQLAALGPTIEDQLGIPRSSVVSAARGARAVEDSAPWARARMAGGAVEGAGVGSGSKRAGGLSFDPWIVLVSGRDDSHSTRFNTIFNNTVNHIHPPPGGQEASPAEEESEGSPEEVEEDRRILAETLIQHGDGLKKLRFGHADYFTEPAVAWHWWIWKVPIVLFISPSTSPERAYDIRFWRVSVRPPRQAQFLSIISDENKWKQLPIWTSKMAPGGERDHIPERLSNAFSYLYVVLEKVPGPVLPIVGALLAQPLLNMMHKRSATRT